MEDDMTMRMTATAAEGAAGTALEERAEDTAAGQKEKVTVTGEFLPSISFALHQNYVPLIRSLVIRNDTEEALYDLTVKISFHPAFAKEYSYTVARLESGGSVEISPVRILLSAEYLFSLTERLVGDMEILVTSDASGLPDGSTGNTVGSFSRQVEVLAYDQWSGLFMMPEMSAAFVTPNHPVIAPVLKKASDILKQWNAAPAFTAYQTQNPNHVKMQMAAVYAALHEEHIIYTNPPASYEETGQRIRLPHVLLEQRQGTCLDLSVLYASCLEAAGLHPLLIFTKNHAFAGAWLEEQTFADCAADDVSALSKRTAEGAEELLLVECTDFVEGKNIDFETALAHGKAHLLHEDEFECVIDVHRCRISGIRPIPVKLEQSCADAGQGGGQTQMPDVTTLDATKFNVGISNVGTSDSAAPINAPKDLAKRFGDMEAGEETAPDRMKVWERKLLDLSLRNTLLNFRVTKNTIQLMTADLGELENCLADGEEFLIKEIPAEWTGTPKDARIYEIENEKDHIGTVAGEEMKNHRIRTFLKPEEMDKNLKSLQRAARVSMEENGTNTLYLALGFLRWYENDVSEKARYAPLVLIPVELARNFRNKGYVIRSRDEETQINITLLEYLKQDHGIRIGGLDPLPCDEHGIDIPLVFHTIRQGILEKRRWNIENMAFIGLFSFGRFVMWNDLRSRSEDLLKNKVVASLMEGRMTWREDAPETDETNPGAKIPPESMAVPLSADSSQMAAIAAAAGGQSFVLHGPPGTGKSQTITNMIANALYQGKSVLFVAEKMAALSVVRSRLEKIGLGPFCLELHSNKANKTSVLNQLNQALEIGKTKIPEESQATADQLYRTTAEELKEIRGQLEYITEAVHRKREYGCSLYEAISCYEQNIGQKGSLTFDRETVAALTGGQIDAWLRLVKDYEAAARTVGAYDQSPWAGYEGMQYSIELREQLEKELQEKEEICRQAVSKVSRLKEWGGITGGDSRELTENLLAFYDTLKDPSPVLAALLTMLSGQPDDAGMIERLNRMTAAGREYQQKRAELLASYEPQILQYPAGDAALRYKQAQNSWFLPKIMQTKKLLKEIRLYAKEPKTVTKEHLPAVYEQLNLLTELQKKITSVPAAETSLTGGMYEGMDTDFTKLQAALDKTVRICRSMCPLSLKDKNRLIRKIAGDTADSDDLAIRQILECAAKLGADIEALDEMTGRYRINLAQEEGSSRWLTDAADTFARFRGSMDTFKEWVHFNQVEQQVKEQGLPQLTEAYHEGAVKADTMLNAMLCNLYYALSVKTITQDETLNHFQGSRYEDRIADYDELLEKFRILTVQELAAGLSEKVPYSAVEGAASSEMGILKRAIKSNGRMMSIRKLFHEIPTLLRRLSPCMLMSPISVAQYIDPEFPKFDLVIFDEASQLETSEAVGTIARGENVVVVGDPKQLPPTNFFSSRHMDEEHFEQEDLESLLDDCLAISMPQRYLEWHYRSRHESLIAYSNAKYYDNKLYTFPSPNDLVSEVKLVSVEGSYDKGKTKQNRAEAEAVVAEIVRRLQDKELCQDSIGVVTFSSVQQNLIEDLLLEEFTKYPELGDMDAQSAEPVFIKNLENVQGDERDVILFSVGYGPDEHGKVSMNFGPLNQEGGWRRLNVAISRARKSMIVYAVIRPEQIDLSRTRSEGVAGLKGFLEYAARGKAALTVHAEQQNLHKDGLVEEIAGAVEAMGYDVKTNIGSSKYKLDIGVVHPHRPDTYLLGILLDGENSKASSLPKDRYILQPGVLDGLGWELMRVWSLDYLDHSKKIQEEIDRRIKELLEWEELSAKAADPDGTDIFGNNETSGTNAGEGHLPLFERIPKEGKSSEKKLPYQSVPVVRKGAGENFYEPDTLPAIRQLAVQILINEAPVSRKLMLRKVLGAWEIARTGSRVERVFDAALQNVQKSETTEGGNLFYWRADQNPEEYDNYRAEDQSGNHRSMDEIAVQEILCAVREVLAEQVALTGEDLVRETGKKFGYTRIGAVIEKAVTNAVAYGREHGKIKEDGGKFMLCEN